ncbi:MAG: VCBS repeat-containing protein [Planctomycetaceae bacterium]
MKRLSQRHSGIEVDSDSDSNGPDCRTRRVGALRASALIGMVALAVLAIGWGVFYRRTTVNDETTNSETVSTETSPPHALPADKAKENSGGEDTVVKLVESEEWILRQTPVLPKLARGVLNMQHPDVQSVDLFDDQVTIVGLSADGSPAQEDEIAHLGVSANRWPVAEQSRSSAAAEAELWKPLFDELEYFERAKFYFVRAEFADADRSEIKADVAFDGLAWTRTRKLVHVRARQQLTWKKRDGPEQDSWRIVKWKQQELTTLHGDGYLFHDVASLVTSPTLHDQVRGSVHHDLLIGLEKRPNKYFSVYAGDRHPSVSVVDLDRDGYDDLYVMARWGRNMMFRNQGDGTFEEIAANIGLDIEDHCSSAIFADFDNDGDADLFLGRTLKRSMYLINEDGHFVDRSASHVSVSLPYLVFSISAADYNGDGLMDLFFATGALDTQGSMSKPNFATQRWLAEFLPDDQAKHLFDLGRNSVWHKIPGPPNVLLINRGEGRFDLAPENSQLAAWRQTTQGTWSDFDDDGDLDIYLSNDYSPNMMFRNDGPGGFVDITAETGTADIGFGMGVSWGDYDLDGRQDLYVTNMFSKAGQRITSQLKSESAHPRYANMSRGNSLFRNLGKEFEKVSGLDQPALQVEKAGWSWCSQFVDIDNDGYLDIHALSGYYTAHTDVELPFDR